MRISLVCKRYKATLPALHFSKSRSRAKVGVDECMDREYNISRHMCECIYMNRGDWSKKSNAYLEDKNRVGHPHAPSL